MRLFAKSASDLSIADLTLLIETRRVEDQHLEYKRELPGGKDEDKREFLADVSALANSDGGILVYGIDERGGQPESLCGVGRPVVDVDCLRLQDMIRSGIEPRLAEFAVHRLPLGDTDGIVIVAVSRSWNAPHRVVFGGINRFYTRQGAQKFQMSLDQLRSSFASLGTERVALDTFRQARLRLVRDGEIPIPVTGDSRIVLHLLPLGMASAARRYDLANSAAMQNVVRPIRDGSYSHRYNIDGFLAHEAGDDGCFGYTQAFHNGAVEIVSSWHLRPRPVTHEQPYPLLIKTPTIEDALFCAFEIAIAFQKVAEVEGPIAIMLSLLAVKGFRLGGVAPGFFGPSDPIDRADLILSDLVISNHDVSAKQALRPALDELWNAFGKPRCFQYDSTGKWIEQNDGTRR